MQQDSLIPYVIKVTSGILLLAIVSLSTVTSVCADVYKGREAYEIGEYEEALIHFRAAAIQGDSEAQFYLGLMYRGGEGVPMDHFEAVNWYRRAAEQGDARAQTNLAIGYVLGRGVEQDSQQALHWYLRAAQQGHTDAQIRLGELYTGALGVARDPILAYAWYSMALLDETTCECIRGYRNEIAAGMSAEDIHRADLLLKQWKKRM